VAGNSDVPVVTVNVALLLVTLPALFVTTTLNCAPLSLLVVFCRV